MARQLRSDQQTHHLSCKSPDSSGNLLAHAASLRIQLIQWGGDGAYVVAEYNRISWCLSERPKDYLPRFNKVDAETYDSSDWSVHFLIATLDFSAKQWRPVIRGHAVTGDIIAPIRKLDDKPNSLVGHEEMTAVAEAIVNIRSYFMPKRVRASKAAARRSA